MLNDGNTYIFNYWPSGPIIENISEVLSIMEEINEYGKEYDYKN